MAGLSQGEVLKWNSAVKGLCKEDWRREQLAIEAFADALEIFPRTLAETAGRSIDTLVELRARHSDNKADSKYLGVNVFKSKITDMKEQVIEPLR